MSQQLTCENCGTQLALNRWRIAQAEVFCPNDQCSEFVQAFWIERTTAVSAWMLRLIR